MAKPELISRVLAVLESCPDTRDSEWFPRCVRTLDRVRGSRKVEILEALEPGLRGSSLGLMAADDQNVFLAWALDVEQNCKITKRTKAEFMEWAQLRYKGAGCPLKNIKYESGPVDWNFSCGCFAMQWNEDKTFISRIVHRRTGEMPPSQTTSRLRPARSVTGTSWQTARTTQPF